MGMFDNIGDQLLNSSKDMKPPSEAVMEQYKAFLKTLTPEQKKAERSKLSGMGNIARNKFIKKRVQNFSSATTKDVKDMGGQEKKGALAKGGKVRGYAYGTPKGGVKKMSSCRGRKAMGSKD
jgi:hypothetical protein